VGHVGDGNFHQMVLYDPTDPQGLERAWDMDKRIVARGLALGGTCSGEHGIGLGKREFLEQEHGAGAMDVMRSLKVALDPKGIMNPGKIFRN
jgi:D-lactate dehydrogenase (cytochrome)